MGRSLGATGRPTPAAREPGPRQVGCGLPALRPAGHPGVLPPARPDWYPPGHGHPASPATGYPAFDRRAAIITLPSRRLPGLATSGYPAFLRLRSLAEDGHPASHPLRPIVTWRRLLYRRAGYPTSSRWLPYLPPPVTLPPHAGCPAQAAAGPPTPEAAVPASPGIPPRPPGSSGPSPLQGPTPGQDPFTSLVGTAVGSGGTTRADHAWF